MTASTRARRVVWLVVCAATLMAGCALTEPEPAVIYRLTAQPRLPFEATLSIKVMPPRSSRPQGGSLGISIAEVGQVVRIDEFGSARWEEPPEAAIARTLEAALRHQDDRPGEARLADARLRWSLDRFEVVERTGGGSAEVVVAIRYELINARTGLTLAAGQVSARETLPRAAPVASVVLAFDRATAAMLDQFIQRLSQSARASR